MVKRPVIATPRSSGPIRALYGVVIRDKCKTADLETMKAYHAVGHDLLKDHKGSAAAKGLADSLKDLEKAIAAKQK